ncbi:unnamed protein product [Mytilus edulis]|uniref:C1q domain-containing protein n=1 Tax=Mytilus edulis TaxID=6550 RepID=A0A8S3T2F8_MYTED|nr:unnamed protein product [Mytilus edulis]
MDMLEKLDILEQKLAQRMADLKKGAALYAFNYLFNDLEFLGASTTVPAFYAYMSSHETNPGKHHTLHFDTIITNIGSAYNRYTGIFTPTVSGTYALSYSIKPYAGAYIPIELVRNTQIIGSVVTKAQSSYEHGASSTVVIQLSAGDACFLRTSNTYTPTGHIYSSKYARSSFSGWRLI